MQRNSTVKPPKSSDFPSDDPSIFSRNPWMWIFPLILVVVIIVASMAHFTPRSPSLASTTLQPSVVDERNRVNQSLEKRNSSRALDSIEHTVNGSKLAIETSSPLLSKQEDVPKYLKFRSKHILIKPIEDFAFSTRDKEAIALLRISKSNPTKAREIETRLKDTDPMYAKYKMPLDVLEMASSTEEVGAGSLGEIVSDLLDNTEYLLTLRSAIAKAVEGDLHDAQGAQNISKSTDRKSLLLAVSQYQEPLKKLYANSAGSLQADPEWENISSQHHKSSNLKVIEDIYTRSFSEE